MFLILCAQDIHRISFGLFEMNAQRSFFLEQVTVHVAPDQYLKALDDTLITWQIPHEQVFEGVIVVTGPGSFTASRVSTTIANGFAFTKSLPVKGIENPDFLDLEALMPLIQQQAFATDFATPTYQAPPHITKPNV